MNGALVGLQHDQMEYCLRLRHSLSSIQSVMYLELVQLVLGMAAGTQFGILGKMKVLGSVNFDATCHNLFPYLHSSFVCLGQLAS